MASRVPDLPPTTSVSASTDRLDSWKEIAAYLKRDERTVRRWEKSEGLPVHRHTHTRQASVYAFKSELDIWWDQGRARLDQKEPEPSAPARKISWGFVLAGVALVVVAVVGAGIWLERTGESIDERLDPGVLAVLPFDNLSGDPQQDYLSDGFTEELITQLARVDPYRLRVIARTTVMKYKGAKKDVAEIAKAIGAHYVLEGSVRQAGSQLRITAQLIRASDQTHLWAESYDREISDLLAVQTNVGQAVAGHIASLTGSRAAKPATPVRPEAYEAYLRARYHHSQGTVAGLEAAIENYKKAVAADPDYALAHAGLARAYVFGIGTRPADAMKQAATSANEALRLQPDLPEALLASALVKLYGEHNWQAARDEFDRLLALDRGNADAHFYYSHYLSSVGLFDRAIYHARVAQEIDPFSPLIGHYVGRHMMFARLYPQAIEEFNKTLALEPGYPWALLFTAIAKEQMGRAEEAVEARQRYWSAMNVDAEKVAQLKEAFAKSGQKGVWQMWAEWTEGFQRKSGYVTSSELAILHAQLGNSDEAFRWLDRAIEDRTRDLIYLKVDPSYDPLRKDPRFAEALRRAGFVGTVRH